MAVRLQISVSGVKAIDQALGAKLAALGDLRPAWIEIGKRLDKLQKSTFEKMGAGSAEGYFQIAASKQLEPWQPLKPATIREKRRQGFSMYAYPLIRTGKLMKSFGMMVLEKRQMVWGLDENDVPYAKYHHSTKPRTKIPRRPVLRIPAQMAKVFMTIIQRHIVKTRQGSRESL